MRDKWLENLAKRATGKATPVKVWWFTWNEEVKMSEQGASQVNENYGDPDFYSKLFHDMRSGLGIAGGYASILTEDQDDNLTGEQITYLFKIKKGCEDTLSLINNANDLIIIRGKDYRLDKEEFDLKETVEISAKRTQKIFKEKNLLIEFCMPEEAVNVFADKEMIGKAAQNSLNQLAEFLPEDSTIKAAVFSSGKKCVISFKAAGPCISPDQIPNLFKPFFTSSYFVSLGIKKIGLNMIVVKKIMDMHNGRVWIESGQGEGICVNLEI